MRGSLLLSLRLLEVHKQLEGWLGHRVGHIVGDINLGDGEDRGLRAVVVRGKDRGRRRWGTARTMGSVILAQSWAWLIIPFNPDGVGTTIIPFFHVSSPGVSAYQALSF